MTRSGSYIVLSTDNIPVELTQLKRWVVWRIEERPGKNGEIKPTKVPYNARTGYEAKSNDSKTWSTYEQAIRAHQQGKYDGIGLMSNADSIIGIDLDKCRNPETGAIARWALEIVHEIDSYTEVSPSGTGLRIFVHGELPAGRRKMDSFEIYNSGRFFTVTGNHVPGTPTTLKERHAEIVAVHTRIVERYEAKKSIDSVLKRIAKDPKVEKLWNGELNGHGSQSEADLALCSHLAQLTSNDAALIDTLFRRSKLYRSKWDEKRGDQTYGEMTISKALDSSSRLTTSTHPKKKQPSSDQIREALHNLGYTFRYNAVTLTIEINGQPISDAIEATIRVKMRDKGYQNLRAIEDVYIAQAHENTYHPIRDYLDNLVWDGMQHIAHFAAHFTCIDPLVTYPDGEKQELFYVYLRRWMIGAVAKVYKREQNMMLVLVGPQNIGKSTVAKWLCSSLPDYFVAQAIQTDDKDSMLRLAKNFIWEVDELDGTIRKSDVAALKGFITRDEVVARPAYARRDIHAPALASLIGTVNKGSGFLADATGNRRFYVTEVGAINWDYTKLDVNQLWAQAVHEYKTGVAQGQQPWLLHSSEHTMQVEANKGHETRTLLDDWIDMDLCLDGGPEVGMTAAEIVDHLRSREHFLTGSGRAQVMELAEALLKRGVVRKQTTIRGVRGMYYLGVSKNVS